MKQKLVNTLNGNTHLDRWLGQALVLGDEVEQVAADAELKDEPDVVLRLVPVVELEHVAAVELVQQLHLIQDLNAHAMYTKRIINISRDMCSYTPSSTQSSHANYTFSMRHLAVDLTATYSMLRLRRALYTNECVPRPISS